MTASTDTDPQVALHDVSTVEVPSLGRIVHVRIDITDDEPTLRPAIVLDGRADGHLLLHVFLLPSDLPLPAASGIVRDERGGWTADAAYGTELGEWRWPDLSKPALTFEV